MVLNLSETEDAGQLQIVATMVRYTGRVVKEISDWGISGSLNNGFWLKSYGKGGESGGGIGTCNNHKQPVLVL